MQTNKPTEEIRQVEINHIRRYLDELYTDSEIIEKLKDVISEATYWRYKSQIIKEDKQRLEKLKQDNFEHSILMAHKGLDYIIKINRLICEDPKTSAFNKRESSIVVAKAYKAKVELLDTSPSDNTIRLVPKQLNTASMLEYKEIDQDIVLDQQQNHHIIKQNQDNSNSNNNSKHGADKPIST